MHYRIRAVLAVAIAAWAGAAAAQDLRNMQSLNQVVRTGLLQFRVVSGRVSLESSRSGNIQTANNFDKQQESLSIQVDSGDTRLLYSWSNGKQQFSIEVSNVSKIRIRYSGNGDDAQVPVEYYQPLQAKTVLTVGPEGKRQVYTRIRLVASASGISGRNQAASCAAFGSAASQLETVRSGGKRGSRIAAKCGRR